MSIAEEAIKASLKTINDPPEKWLNLKDLGTTKFITKEQPWHLRKQLLLQEFEVPLYEYYSNKCYSLITSIRVISEREGNYNEFKLKDIFQVRRHYYKDFHKESEPWKTLRVIDDSRKEFLIDFGEDYPCYFAKNLILNIAFQMRFGRWFTNPGGDKNIKVTDG